MATFELIVVKPLQSYVCYQSKIQDIKKSVVKILFNIFVIV